MTARYLAYGGTLQAPHRNGWRWVVGAWIVAVAAACIGWTGAYFYYTHIRPACWNLYLLVPTEEPGRGS